MTEAELTVICDGLASGKSLRAICRELGKSESLVRYYLAKDETIFALAARARELGCDALADECIEIADEPVSKDDSVAVANKRVRIDTRVRLIGKWSQRYSDKLAVTTKTEVTHKYDLDSLSDTELDQLERILANARASQGGEGEAVASSVH